MLEIFTAKLGSAQTFLPWFLSEGFFILFWIITLVAFLVPKACVRRTYLAFFFGSMFAVGLIGMPLVAWPFHHWHLWARILPANVEIFEVGLEDESGNLWAYDSRAARPLVSEVLRRRFAQEMFAGKNGEMVAQWLLAKAKTYHPQSAPMSWLEFPVRTPGPRWPEGGGEVAALAVQRTRVELGPTLEDSVFTPLGEKKFR